MAHADYHPVPDPDCFGCKVSTIGYDGRHLTSSRTDDLGAVLTSHRSGREDVLIKAPTVRLDARVSEQR